MIAQPSNKLYFPMLAEGSRSLLLGFALAVFVTVSCKSVIASPEAPFQFYAVYDRIANLDSLGLKEIHNSLLSANGQVVVIYGRRHDGRMAMFRMTATGSDVKEITLPEEIDALWEGTISADGARAFFRHHWDKAIYKLEGDLITKVFDADSFGQVSNVDQIQTDSGGEWLFFREPRHSIWRVRHDGGAPRRILQEKEVARENGIGANISQYRVSANGEVLVFVVDGYWDNRGVYHSDQELFVWKSGHIRALTRDPGNVFKTHLAVNATGTSVAFSAAAPVNKLRIVSTESGEEKDLETIGHVGGIVMNGSGSSVFFYDQALNGGRLSYADGRPTIDLFPAYNVNAIALNSPWSLAMDTSGERIGFRTGDSVYTGYLASRTEVSGAPVIERLMLDPPVGSAVQAQEGTTLRVNISDPDGSQDIVRISTNMLSQGHTDNDIRNLSVYFHHPANDAGHPPDEKAGDGVFASYAAPGGKPDSFEQQSVRVAVMDASGTVVLADTGLTESGGTTLVAVEQDKEAETAVSDRREQQGTGPWSATSRPMDPTCARGCREIKHIQDVHGADVRLKVDPAVDDAVAQWGDCLQSFVDCVGDSETVIRTCVESSRCPTQCREEFTRRAASAGGKEQLLDIYESVFIVEGAPCVPPQPGPPS